MKQKRQLKHYCQQCGEVYHPRRTSARFCGPTCRQRYFRETHKAPVKRADIAIKRYETKLKTVKLVSCVQCNATFFVNGLQGCKMYCTRACKQRAYRERRAAGLVARRNLVTVPDRSEWYVNAGNMPAFVGAK